MSLLHSFRWFGPKDPVSLSDIRQTGARGVVTALHEISCGDIWQAQEIRSRLELIKEYGLEWAVVESLNVHDEIKRGGSGRDRLIKNYQASLRNLAHEGIKTVCYNFMPVLDWTRTELDHRMPDGAFALRYDEVHMALFDMFILQRQGAENSYAHEVCEKATILFKEFDSERLDTLARTIMAGIPGSAEVYSLATFKALLNGYSQIDAGLLRMNLRYFLEAIIPVASEVGIKMCVHPDDPPFSVLGLPRIVSTRDDLKFVLECVPETANGLTFCSGSLGARAENDLPAIIKEFGERIHFFHLRSVHRENDKSFFEDYHLDGSTRMYVIMKAVLLELQRRKIAGNNDQVPMRADHGHRLESDPHPDVFPGYSLLGRLKGLAELRGLEIGILNSF